MVMMAQPGEGPHGSQAAARERARLFDGLSTDGQAVAAWIDGSELVIEFPAEAPVGAEASRPAASAADAVEYRGFHA